MTCGFLQTSDKAQIYYEDQGEGTTIIFVPGHMCTTKFFRKNVDGLKSTFRIITFDPRGFGNSSKVLYGNCVERHADDINELILHLALDHVILIGWSLSGSVVMTYAHKYQSQHLAAIGLIDCALFPFSPAPWNTYAARNYNMDEWNQKYSLWFLNPEIYYSNFLQRLNCGLRNEDLRMIRDEITKTPPWIGFALHTDWCHTNTEQWLKSLTIPCFIAAGELKDGISIMSRHYFDEISTYQELHEFQYGGHILFWAEYQKFNMALTNFINKVQRRI